MIVDSQGILNRDRPDIFMRRAEFVDKWRLCQITNAAGRTGGIAEAMAGADAVIALSKPGPGTILPEICRTHSMYLTMLCSGPIRLRYR
jgi:malate dehydrogenase (oxaloacetate-decarboxylating)